MKKISTLFIIGALVLFYKPSQAQTSTAPFTTPSPVPPAIPAKLIDFKGSINSNKVILQWVVKENETADQFEVERSADGKNFVMAALVFGTDKPETDNYQFYEKAGDKRMMYRIKLINKDRKTEYSTVISIDPADIAPEK